MGGSFFSVLKVGLLSESVGTPSGVWKIYPHFLNTAGDGRPLYPGGAGRISPVVAVILRFPLFHSLYYDYESLIKIYMDGEYKGLGTRSALAYPVSLDGSFIFRAPYCCLDKFMLESRPQILYNNNASTPLYPTNVRKGDALWM